MVDADLSGYFDSIPHAELMKSVSRRISDGRILRLIKMWLEAPVETRDRRGGTQQTTRNKDEGKRSPQGVPDLTITVKHLHETIYTGLEGGGGHEKRLRAHIVNYADDFVICCSCTEPTRAMATMRLMMSKLKLTVNETKTQLCVLPDGAFVFFGVHLRTLLQSSFRGSLPGGLACERRRSPSFATRSVSERLAKGPNWTRRGWLAG